MMELIMIGTGILCTILAFLAMITNTTKEELEEELNRELHSLEEDYPIDL